MYFYLINSPFNLAHLEAVPITVVKVFGIEIYAIWWKTAFSWGKIGVIFAPPP